MLVRAIAAISLITSAAAAQEPARDDTLRKAGDIATQPARDFGIDKAAIPPVIQAAVADPYAVPDDGSCDGLADSILALNAALGPDFVSGTAENENRTGRILEAGGRTLVNTLIPFRGLVREISGAAPAQRKLDAAISTALARRGFLRGLNQAKGCAPVEKEMPHRHQAQTEGQHRH